MSSTFQNSLSLLARFLLVALFLPSGIAKLTGFAGTVGFINSVGIPFPALAAALALTVEILGGLALRAGFQTRVVALVLAAFTLAATLLFHNFWGAAANQAFVQQLMFFKNIGVIGGLCALAAHGAGSWSLDKRNV